MALNKQKSPALLALTSTAMALPGISAKASTVPEKTTFSYRISEYREDNINASDVLFGDLQRYDIDVQQFNLSTAFGERVSMNINTTSETMSGASPWGAGLNADNTPYVIMSGATIIEEREDILVSTRYHWDDRSIGINFGHSGENDYESFSGGIDGEWELNNKLTTLNAAINFSSDDISPSDAKLFGRILRASKRSTSLYFGISQVINKHSTIQAGVSHTQLSGFLTDPYKLSDNRPDERSQWAWSLRYRHYLSDIESAFHADYRYYHDNWDTDSHTVKVSLHHNFNKRLQIIPSVRYYSQSAADFFSFSPDFSNPQAEFSNDYRLSAFSAVTLGLRLVFKLNDQLNISLSGDSYHSSGNHGHDNPEYEHPGLVDFTRYTAGFDYSF